MQRDYVFYRNLKKVYPVVDRAEGVYIWDMDGKQYIDGSGGACVVTIGHGVSEVIEAMSAQAKRICFAHGSHFTSEAAKECAEHLFHLVPDSFLRHVYFISGGSEAVETAIKVVRQYFRDVGQPEKFKVISRWSSFHGNTTGTLALGGYTGRRRPYNPLIMHTPHIEPTYCFRCPFEKEPASCHLECADQLERTIKYEGPDSVAAFIGEPVVGATAGALVPRDGYWQRIRDICNAYNIMLIADEVMTGIGRCGKNFCLDNWEVIPDVIVLAKGLSSGYSPLGAIIVSDEIYEGLKRTSGIFVHGHTYGQNPLSTAAGAAVLKYIEEHDLIARSEAMGSVLFKHLNKLNDLDIVGNIRGLGLFAGIELVKDKKSKQTFEPELKLWSKVGHEAFKRGLITYPGAGGVDGTKGDHILLAPPFIITEEQIAEMVEILYKSISSVQYFL